jgi:hypothetical protein
LPQLLLSLRRKFLELAVILKRMFLFARRNVLVAAQPVSGVALLLPSLLLLCPWSLWPLLLRFSKETRLGERGECHRHADGQHPRRPNRDVSFAFHSYPLYCYSSVSFV